MTINGFAFLGLVEHHGDQVFGDKVVNLERP
jgi:hypothetical protein